MTDKTTAGAAGEMTVVGGGTTGTIAGLTEEAITMTARASRGEEEVQDAGTISGTTVGAGRVMIMVSMCSYCCRLHRQATCLRGCSA